MEVISTGGTAARLRESGVRVTDVSEVTGFPECLDGRVKTLHPKVHAGILADRSKPEHLEQIRKLEVEPIDLVVVNLYPFEAAAEREGIGRAELIEEIDIGGPTILRAASKNADHVVPVCDPADYPAVIVALGGGGIPVDLSRRLAAKVFTVTAAYDAAIAARLAPEPVGADALPSRLPLGLRRVAQLRYGENPHQRGALYRPAGLPADGLAALDQLQGKELSYNNYLDLDAAYRLAAAFTLGTAVVVKHLNPCGVGFDEDAERAYRRALAADPVSAFGGIVALNRPLTAAAASAMKEIFLECIVAPEVEPAALEVLAGKKNLRVVTARFAAPPLGLEIRSVAGAWLVQSPDGPQGDAGAKDRHPARADPGGDRGPGAGLDHGPERQVQRHRDRRRRRNAGSGLRSDQSGGRGPPGRGAGGQGGREAGGEGPGFGRLLPLPGRDRRRGGRRGDRDHPARGLHPRRPGDRCRRRARHGHGLHGKALFPALILGKAADKIIHVRNRRVRAPERARVRRRFRGERPP